MQRYKLVTITMWLNPRLSTSSIYFFNISGELTAFLNGCKLIYLGSRFMGIKIEN
jgi:hypothetical protein